MPIMYGAYKCNVVVVTKMGAYLYSWLLIFYGCLLSKVYKLPCTTKNAHHWRSKVGGDHCSPATSHCSVATKGFQSCSSTPKMSSGCAGPPSSATPPSGLGGGFPLNGPLHNLLHLSE